MFFKKTYLINRFDSDVATEHPDFVWIMTGTNDGFQDVLPEIFSFQINKLRQKCAKIGAEVIVFTSSVGRNNLPAFNQRTREYAKKVEYFDGNYKTVEDGLLISHFLNFDNVEILASTLRRFGYLGRKDGTLLINECYFSFGVDVIETTDIKEGSGVDTMIGSIPSGLSTNLEFKTSNNRYVCFKHNNVDVVSRFITGYIDYKI